MDFTTPLAPPRHTMPSGHVASLTAASHPFLWFDKFMSIEMRQKQKTTANTNKYQGYLQALGNLARAPFACWLGGAFAADPLEDLFGRRVGVHVRIEAAAHDVVDRTLGGVVFDRAPNKLEDLVGRVRAEGAEEGDEGDLDGEEGEGDEDFGHHALDEARDA